MCTYRVLPGPLALPAYRKIDVRRDRETSEGDGQGPEDDLGSHQGHSRRLWLLEPSRLCRIPLIADVLFPPTSDIVESLDPMNRNRTALKSKLRETPSIDSGQAPNAPSIRLRRMESPSGRMFTEPLDLKDWAEPQEMRFSPFRQGRRTKAVILPEVWTWGRRARG